ncbi:MAG: peptide chain release factor N(5)-glutamine methyltransferase [Candidatus Margulisbacteria bacterium]|nr:peptide chain release factor N(5)-glutamine methyltransferase [Candidatus Margulisiibacteriota bacterium]
MEVWTISKILDWTTDYFKKYDIEWPHLEAEILLAHALNCKRIELYTKYEKNLSAAELDKFKQMIKRRSQHEPIAYITGYKSFMSLEFYVNRSVLIPRPETEELVETIISLIKTNSNLTTIADIGTGSGVIAITLAKYLKDINVIAIDSSTEALQVAQKNSQTHQVDQRCQLVNGHLLEPLQEKVDLIVSNPPYIPSSVIEELPNDVKDWEPKQALDGGPNGLDYIRNLIENAPAYLKPGGFLFLEIGYDQGEKVSGITAACNKYQSFEILKDSNNHDRVLKAQT